LAFSVISITVNLLTIEQYSLFWSGVVACSLLYALITIRNTIISKTHIGGKVLIQFISLSALVFVVDICSGFEKWSTNYVIPWLIVLSTLIITIVAFAKKSRWADYTGYLFATFFISLCPIFLFIFNLATVIWTSIAAIVYSILTIIGLVIFSDKQFKDETKKRFHF
jgi:hypothetical protein